MTRKLAPKDQSEYEDAQKKMAQQLGERVGTSPEEIERGVENFLKKSRTFERREMKPPYRRASWYEDFFDLIKQRSISSFSLEFIRLNIVPGSEAYKFRSGLLFLGLIDERGNPTSKLQKLRVTGEAFSQNLAKIVSEAYKSLFEAIIVEKAKPESVVNFIIEKYGYSRTLAEEATSLFVYFCNTAGIPISEDLKKFLPTAKESPRVLAGSTRSQVPLSRKVKTTDETFDESFVTLKSPEFSFAVKKELSAMELAKSQINAYLEYQMSKLRAERKSSDNFFNSTFGQSAEKTK